MDKDAYLIFESYLSDNEETPLSTQEPVQEADDGGVDRLEEANTGEWVYMR